MNLPNKLTMLRIFLIPVFLFFYLSSFVPGHYVIALVVFIAASLTDMLDGKIARKYNLVTDFGKFMDPLADKLLVMSALICFVETINVPAIVVFIILAREFIVTSLRLLAVEKGRVIAADIFGKVKTVSQMFWIIYTILFQALSSAFGVVSSVLSTIWVLGMIVVVAATLLSGFNYMWKNRDIYLSSK